MTDESKDPFIMTNPGLFVKKTVTVFYPAVLMTGMNRWAKVVPLQGHDNQLT